MIERIDIIHNYIEDVHLEHKITLYYFNNRNKIAKELTTTHHNEDKFFFNNINFTIPNNIFFRIDFENSDGSYSKLSTVGLYLHCSKLI